LILLQSKKKYLGDIIAASLVEGISSLWTFDLKKVNFDEPWSMLIHDLGDNFSYTNILDTPTYTDCMKIIDRSSPKLRISISLSIFFLICFIISYYILGKENKIIDIVLAVSGFTGAIAFFFIFYPPRK
jgi:hypothetical protein